MRKLISLTKILFKSNNGFLDTIVQEENSAIDVILLTFVVICLSWLTVGYITYEVFDSLSQNGNERLLLSAALIIVSFITLVSSTIYMVSIFYFSKDIDLLIPLPINSSRILTAKFLVVLIYQYVINFLIFIPIYVVYGFKMEFGVVYYLYGIFIYLLIPMVPLVMVSILLMIIMGFSSLGRNKEIVKIVGFMSTVCLSLSISVIFKYSDRFFSNYLNSSNSQLNIKVLNVLPHLKLAVLAVDNYNKFIGATYLLGFICLVALLFALFLVVGEKLYLKSVIGGSEIFSTKEKVKEEQIFKAIKRKNQLRSYVAKELKMITRNPVYLINCLVSPLILPTMIIVSIVSQKGSYQIIDGMLGFQNNHKNMGLVIGCFIVFVFIQVGANLIALTSISRESIQVNTMKHIPMSYRNQIICKIIVSSLLICIPCFLSIVAGALVLKLTAIYYILIFALALPVILYGSILGLNFDLRSPSLNWQSETQMIKQNLNVIAVNIATYLEAAAAVYCLIRFKPNLIVVITIYVVIFTIKNVYAYKTLSTRGIEYLKTINF
ncbi:MAG: hypothetical protein Q8936_12070 [Bacillota bacterium]|nr:hypothetical protein [Bacillota bacterium]